MQILYLQVAAQVLSELGADMARVRTQVIQMMSGQTGKDAGASQGSSSQKSGDVDAQGGSAVLDQFGRNLRNDSLLQFSHSLHLRLHEP